MFVLGLLQRIVRVFRIERTSDFEVMFRVMMDAVDTELDPHEH